MDQVGRRVAFGTVAVAFVGMATWGGPAAGGGSSLPPLPEITPATVAPGEPITVSGVGCPAGEWAGEFVVDLWMEPGAHESSSEVNVDPPGGPVSDLTPRVPDEVVTVVPAEDGSWSGSLATRPDPVAAGQTVAAWCHTEDLDEGAVIYSRAITFPGSPLVIEPASGPPGTTIRVSGAHCPLADWSGPFEALVYVHHLWEGGSGAVFFPGEQEPGPLPPPEEVSASVSVAPGPDGTFAVELVVPEPPPFATTTVVAARCATDDQADGVVYYQWSVFELTEAPPPAAPPQTAPPEFTG